MMKEYKFHEMANVFPLMGKEELNELAQDIKKNGLFEPITLYEEEILDGRNRYSACLIAKVEPKFKHLPNGINPLDYIIAQNLMRRHLSPAQKGDIALLLIPKFEERAKKRQLLGKKIENDLSTSEVLRSEKGRSLELLAKKLKTSPNTIEIAKRVKEIEDPEIKEKWKSAKKGEATVKSVKMLIARKEAIKDLPLDLREEVEKEDPFITIEEAKIIAEIPSEVLRKQEVAERARVKKRQDLEVEKKKDLAEGKNLPKEKYFDKDSSKVSTFDNICRRVVNEITFDGLEGYGKSAKKACVEMMKIVFEHLRKELKKAGEVAPRKVIEVNVDK